MTFILTTMIFYILKSRKTWVNLMKIILDTQLIQIRPRWYPGPRSGQERIAAHGEKALDYLKLLSRSS
jgi:hypothetical protein